MKFPHTLHHKDKDFRYATFGLKFSSLLDKKLSSYVQKTIKIVLYVFEYLAKT